MFFMEHSTMQFHNMLHCPDTKVVTLIYLEHAHKDDNHMVVYRYDNQKW